MFDVFNCLQDGQHFRLTEHLREFLLSFWPWQTIQSVGRVERLVVQKFDGADALVRVSVGSAGFEYGCHVRSDVAFGDRYGIPVEVLNETPNLSGVSFPCIGTIPT